MRGEGGSAGDGGGLEWPTSKDGDGADWIGILYERESTTISCVGTREMGGWVGRVRLLLSSFLVLFFPNRCCWGETKRIAGLRVKKKENTRLFLQNGHSDSFFESEGVAII
jgi:hypothetical protein